MARRCVRNRCLYACAGRPPLLGPLKNREHKVPNFRSKYAECDIIRAYPTPEARRMPHGGLANELLPLIASRRWKPSPAISTILWDASTAFIVRSLRARNKCIEYSRVRRRSGLERRVLLRRGPRAVHGISARRFLPSEWVVGGPEGEG